MHINTEPAVKNVHCTTQHYLNVTIDLNTYRHQRTIKTAICVQIRPQHMQINRFFEPTFQLNPQDNHYFSIVKYVDI